MGGSGLKDKTPAINYKFDNCQKRNENAGIVLKIAT